ncbi:hypothetical protein RI129_013069 [Pyrocoelia pectoralis]|uniref:Uncharacterized protein n=1 Tax=Pyrocoelia pectoralis TaxID=417401 RepID=A0AAN7V7J3_9COLE
MKKSIHNLRYKLDSINNSLYNTFQPLTEKRIHPIIFDTVDRLIENAVESTFTNKSLRQKQKFERLYKKPEQQTETLKTVHNFSNINISQDAINILQKGFNFAITPKRIPVENIITNVEIALTTVEQPIADEIRLDIANILKKARPPAQNVTKRELIALKELKNNNDVLILPADKGNATVIVNSNEYHQKMITLLNSSEYKTNNAVQTEQLIWKRRLNL